MKRVKPSGLVRKGEVIFVGPNQTILHPWYFEGVTDNQKHEEKIFILDALWETTTPFILWQDGVAHAVIRNENSRTHKSVLYFENGLYIGTYVVQSNYVVTVNGVTYQREKLSTSLTIQISTSV